MNALWPIIEKTIPFDMFKPASTPGLTAKQRAEERKRQPSETQIKAAFGAILKDTPYPIQADTMTPDGMLWSTLKNDCLLTSWEDLSLKHGSVIPGIWYVLGVLDAHPVVDDDTNPAVVEERWNNAVSGNEITDAIAGVLSTVRRTFGRPSGSYGLTPLLIFRKMPANKSGSKEFMEREFSELSGVSSA
ncbi:hypothetical protein AA11826_1525 [Komagataeibacter oboediens DSM 11826]|nr:hypothetical protein [Komagataeibacter oboediens]GBR36393.1 hypothetical protein AA11826_1525 [Komagataeibacter oboediens DSM 11826]